MKVSQKCKELAHLPLRICLTRRTFMRHVKGIYVIDPVGKYVHLIGPDDLRWRDILHPDVARITAPFLSPARSLTSDPADYMENERGGLLPIVSHQDGYDTGAHIGVNTPESADKREDEALAVPGEKDGGWGGAYGHIRKNSETGEGCPEEFGKIGVFTIAGPDGPWGIRDGSLINTPEAEYWVPGLWTAKGIVQLPFASVNDDSTVNYGSKNRLVPGESDDGPLALEQAKRYRFSWGLPGGIVWVEDGGGVLSGDVRIHLRVTRNGNLFYDGDFALSSYLRREADIWPWLERRWYSPSLDGDTVPEELIGELTYLSLGTHAPLPKGSTIMPGDIVEIFSPDLGGFARYGTLVP